MSKKWHKGPPPSVGWWPASFSKDSNAIRWWDGAHWSCLATKGYPLEEVKRVAKIRSGIGHIEWQHRPASWPKRSRT